MPANVVVRHLVKRYGGVDVVKGVSFAIEAGEIFGLLGPNGAGKTTTLECVIGLREPDGGEMEVCGLDARRQMRAVKQKIGVALQTTALQDKITPREALTLFGSFYRERATPVELLQRFALTENADARFDTLSGGQRQRLALALAFVNRPEIVLLDEPTTGLDPQSRRELHAAIKRMKQDGHTVLLTTHYLEEAEQLCDRIAIIDHGRIVATGAPRELVAQSSAMQSVTLVTVQPLEREQLARLPGVQELVCDGATARFRTAEATQTLAALAGLLVAQHSELIDLHVRKASLEDVFIGLTREDDRVGPSGGPSAT
ncbi:MAG: ABC transporter ATP-binding protein [Verrucomicrobia bacterium]|nr:ABC transporter ATP-binding protein [Verrucomicrobiota bacterium]